MPKRVASGAAVGTEPAQKAARVQHADLLARVAKLSNSDETLIKRQAALKSLLFDEKERIKEVNTLYALAAKKPAAPEAPPTEPREKLDTDRIPGLALPAAPRELDSGLNPTYALSEGSTHPLKKPDPPPGTTAPVPLLGATVPEIGGSGGGGAEEEEPATTKFTADGSFATVGPRNGLQRKVHRLTQENRELKHFILQRGKQVEGLYADLNEAFVGMAARMEVFQSQFAILVEDHRLAANALSRFEKQHPAEPEAGMVAPNPRTEKMD